MPSRGTCTSLRSGASEHHDQVEGAAPGSGQPPVPIQVKNFPGEMELGVLVDEKLNMTWLRTGNQHTTCILGSFPAVWAAGEREDTPSLFHSGETPHAEMPPTLRCPAQGRCGPAGST